MLLPLYLSIKKSNNVSWKHPNISHYVSNYVSNKFPNPPEALKQYPVIICVHGFGASPFEWEEFAQFAEENKCLVSNIFLGKHKSIKEFSTSTWENWIETVTNEYQKLSSIGFENISLCGSSTGATLIIHALHQKLFRPSIPLRQVILIDPLLDIKEKMLYKVPYLKNILFDVKVLTTLEESGNWIPKRPINSLLQLLDLINKTKRLLESKYSITNSIKINVFNASHDPVISKSAASKIVESLKKNGVIKINHTEINSKLHVFTRLRGRSVVKRKDIENQQFCFRAILKLVSSRY